MPLVSAKEIPENIVVFSQCLGNIDSGVLLPYEVDVTNREILADDVSSVVTLGVVPLEAVIEEVVEERHAGLLPKPVLLEDTVRLGAAAGPGLAPPVELPPVEDVGLAHRGQGRRPEPAADVVGLEPGLLASIHLLVAESAAAPDLPHAGSGHVLAHEVLLSLALHADQVHAPLPAVVPGSEPVPPGVPQGVLVAVPGEPVGLTPGALSVTNLILSAGAEVGLRKADLATAAGIHLCPLPVPGPVSRHPIPQEPVPVVLSRGSPVVISVSVSAEIILRLSEC